MQKIWYWNKNIEENSLKKADCKINLDWFTNNNQETSKEFNYLIVVKNISIKDLQLW